MIIPQHAHPCHWLLFSFSQDKAPLPTITGLLTAPLSLQFPCCTSHRLHFLGFPKGKYLNLYLWKSTIFFTYHTSWCLDCTETCLFLMLHINEKLLKWEEGFFIVSQHQHESSLLLKASSSDCSKTYCSPCQLNHVRHILKVQALSAQILLRSDKVLCHKY